MYPHLTNENIREKRELQISRVFVEYLLILLLYTVFRRVLQLKPMESTLFLGVMLLYLIVRYRNCLIGIVVKQGGYFLLAELIALVIYLISSLQGNVTSKTLMNYIAYTCALCIPMLLLGMNIFNKRILYYALLNVSWVMTILGSFIIFAPRDEVYSMGYSYRMLVPLLLHTNEFIEKKKWYYILIAIYELLLIVKFGSRGALLCFMVFCILRVYMCMGNSFFKMFGVVGICAIAGGYNIIGNWLFTYMERHNIYNRTLTLIFSQLFYTSDRDVLQKQAIELLKSRWVFGYGAASDINLLGQYPHNVFVEILYDYGIIIGGVFCLLILWRILCLFRSPDRPMEIFFLCLCFIPLLISGSYLKNELFFFWVGLYLADYRCARRVRKGNDGKW